MRGIRFVRKYFARRRQYDVQKNRPAQRAPDAASVSLVAILLVGTTFLVNLVHTQPLKGRAQSYEDAAEHVFIASDARALADAPPVQRACVGSVTPVIRTQPCSMTERAAWLWAAPNALRNAMGEKPCWWYADQLDLVAISGVTEAWAARALEERSSRAHARFPGELEAALGAHRTRLIDEAVSIDCALQMRAQR